MKKTISGVEIEAVQGNIADQPDIDAVVNAANAELMPGGGVAGAIHRAAGPGLERECRPLAPISPGEAVITAAHDLPNKHVIHALGPVHGRDKPEAELLANCYENSLRLADEHGLHSIAFPAISTGVFGYPLEEAARVSLETVMSAAESLSSLKKVRFVLFSADELEVYEEVLAEL
ncbi:MAG: macro domain-containing protein [Rubrobacteraceae bacterium]